MINNEFNNIIYKKYIISIITNKLVFNNIYCNIINMINKAITALAFADGRNLVLGHREDTFQLWECISQFFGHKVRVMCVAFSPNNNYPVSIVMDWSFRLIGHLSSLSMSGM